MAASTKQKEPGKRPAKSAREATPVAQPAKQPPRIHAEVPRPAATPTELPVPDLGTFGVSDRDARVHLGACESCGRAYRHVMKNPKDVMALQYFGRNLATCLATNAPARAAAEGHAAP